MRGFVWALLLTLGLTVVSDAQQTSPVLVPAVLPVANLTASAAVCCTLTLAPNSQTESIYIYEIDIQNCAGASAVTAANPTSVTTTNIAGGLAFTVGSGVGAGLCTNQVITYPTGLKSQTPGLPVTVVSPTFVTNQTIRVNVAYRSAL